MHPRRLAVLILVGAALTLPQISPATAALSTWTAKVVAVNDGDTFDIDTNGDGNIDARVRMIGVQAMELKDYVAKTGDCHGPEAFRRLEDLIEGKTVRLSAQRAVGNGLKGRLQRFVAVKIGGKWRDVGGILLKEGHVLWFPNPDEPSKNVKYQRAARSARAKGVGLWDRDFCGKGPDQAAKLALTVQWDADGVDATNVNGEWVRIKNNGTSPVDIGGWFLRESALRQSHSPTAPLRQVKFAKGTSVPAGEFITVYVGRGRDTASEVYWNQSVPVFENWEPDGRNSGDGAYLFDAKGDLRADFMYPCLAKRCSDPADGHLEIADVVWDPDGTDTAATESITIRIPPGSDKESVPLENYLVETWPYSYAFGADDVLRKGVPLVLTIGAGVDTPTHKFWGLPDSILANTGDSAQIRTYDNIVLYCTTWAGGRCRGGS